MRGVPAYAIKNPELGYWHALEMLMRAGIVERLRVEDMPVEQFMFYILEMEAEQKYQDIKQKEAESKMKSARGKLRH